MLIFFSLKCHEFCFFPKIITISVRFIFPSNETQVLDSIFSKEISRYKLMFGTTIGYLKEFRGHFVCFEVICDLNVLLVYFIYV